MSYHHCDDEVEDDDVGFDVVAVQLMVDEKTRHHRIGKVRNCWRGWVDDFH